MSVPIYIGFDAREWEAAFVLAHSLRKHASRPLEIRMLHRHMLPCLDGDTRPGSTAFTYSRFGIPYLRGYRGKALFLDSDMVAYGDICEVLDLPMDGLAIRCTQHQWQPTATIKMDGQAQQPMPRKLWSSFMLMDCSRLTLWTPKAIREWSGAELHRFVGIPDEQIGEIDLAWNEVERLTDRTKLFHWTEGGPWFEKCQNCAHADAWIAARDEWRLSLERN